MGVAFALPGRMGRFGRPAVQFLIAAVLAMCVGCQYSSVSITQLELHQSHLNRTGLTIPRENSMLEITLAPPETWDKLPAQHNLVYSHQQWRSPDRQVGMGVAYVHMPLAVSPQTIIWFAKAEYVRSGDVGGRLLRQWTDPLGRCWFAAEDAEYHVMGYAMTRGCDAWIVYSGYRLAGNPPKAEVALAARGADSVAPLPEDR